MAARDAQWLDEVYHFMVSRRIESVNFSAILQNIPYEGYGKCINLIRNDRRFHESTSQVSLITRGSSVKYMSPIYNVISVLLVFLIGRRYFYSQE